MHRLQLCGLLTVLACSSRSAPLPTPQSSHTQRTADHAELLRLHARAREAHLSRRADWLVNEWADSLFSVSHGRVSVTKPSDGQHGFQEYLDAVDFQAWDDIVPPRIRISADGQMAYIVVEKRVHLTPRDTGGREAERTRFAWLSVYEKVAGRWRLAAIASTDRPDSL